MGIRAVRDRIHTLLTTTAGVRRALDAPLRREIDSASEPFAVAETVEPTYVLRWAGDTDSTPKDSITGNKTMRTASFRLTLSVFAGHGEGGGSDVQESDAELADLWEKTVHALENPSNYNKAVTGWIWAGGFAAGPVTIQGARARIDASFRVRYDVTVADL